MLFSILKDKCKIRSRSVSVSESARDKWILNPLLCTNRIDKKDGYWWLKVGKLLHREEKDTERRDWGLWRHT